MGEGVALEKREVLMKTLDGVSLLDRGEKGGGVGDAIVRHDGNGRVGSDRGRGKEVESRKVARCALYKWLNFEKSCKIRSSNGDYYPDRYGSRAMRRSATRWAKKIWSTKRSWLGGVNVRCTRRVGFVGCGTKAVHTTDGLGGRETRKTRGPPKRAPGSSSSPKLANLHGAFLPVASHAAGLTR